MINCFFANSQFYRIVHGQHLWMSTVDGKVFYTFKGSKCKEVELKMKGNKMIPGKITSIRVTDRNTVLVTNDNFSAFFLKEGDLYW